ncbi:MAG: nucleoside kinase, partial [Spirochaetales bacterium]|nr:nucleoside kinase [Spirochaetales bacterium]
MRKITVSVKGKEITMPASSTAKEILIKAGELSDKDLSYGNNPIVGVLINGELNPVGAPVSMSCDVKPVRAFDDFGRRIYRHSICYLLSYAATLVLPKRHLVIGHSLGDGFYFNFNDNKTISDEEIDLLISEMRKIIAAALD